ncbi:MAG: PHP domain-containing protein [Bacillota bacterium]|nr:PHP domain-containing protein [Bacillota bacterium]
MRVNYDLHLHTCLSPCGDNDMTPNNIVNMAKLLGYSLIAVTDHNSVKNCRAVMKVGQQNNLCVVPGMEICTSEEIHVVCLFQTIDDAESFGTYVYNHLLKIKNKPEIYGNQIIMNEQDEVTGKEEILLVTACKISINKLPKLISEYNGICFPAHIDRNSYSVLSALGEIPAEAEFTAAEITSNGDVELLKQAHPKLNEMILLLDSDAHYLENMPEPKAWIELKEITPKCMIETLKHPESSHWGRK